MKADSKNLNQDYKQTEEYKNLIAIIVAYRDKNPGRVDDLQTQSGREVAGYVAGIQWLPKLEKPTLINYNPLGGGNESELHFSFSSPGSVRNMRVVVKFWLYRGRRCLNNIYLPDKPYSGTLLSDIVWKPGYELAAPQFVEILKTFLTQAKAVASGTTRFDDMSKNLAEFQNTASLLGYADKPEVTNFVFAAINVIGFATTWQQITKAATTANIENEWKKSIESTIELKLSQLNPSMDASFRTTLASSVKDAMSESCERTINALSVDQSNEFKHHTKELQDAYRGILKLAEMHAYFQVPL